MNIRPSNGNSKLGKLPNISLIPVADCGNCQMCKATCYAKKAWVQYPDVRKAWKANSQAFRSDMDSAFAELDGWLRRKRKPVPFFRIHVAGDFLDQRHVDGYARLARKHPDTKFLAFTKMHDLDYSGVPQNMTVVLSMWPGMPMPSQNIPRAWMQDGTETRVPENAIACPGNCESCGMCWSLPQINRDVVFDAH